MQTRNNYFFSPERQVSTEGYSIYGKREDENIEIEQQQNFGGISSEFNETNENYNELLIVRYNEQVFLQIARMTQMMMKINERIANTNKMNMQVMMESNVRMTKMNEKTCER